MYVARQDGNGFYYVKNTETGELARYTDESGTEHPAVNLTQEQADALVAELNA